MMIQRKYDFKNGTIFDAEQVDAELNQLIGAVNNLESADTSIKAAAQMKKITNDTGDVKVKVSTTTGDILQELIAAGIGFHTFYAIAGSKNLPGTVSIRGEAHITSSGFGWVKAYDTNNKSWTNSLNNGTWDGWDYKLSSKDSQGILAGDTTGWATYPDADATITPSKKLSQCRNGWIVVWSDYDPSVGANDYDFHTTLIPKAYGQIFSGKSHLFTIPNNLSSSAYTSIVKRLYISDSTIKGHDDNKASGNGANDVCIRAVLEW